MNLRQYILVFFFGTAIASAAWILVVLHIDPTTADVLALTAFYFSLFVALSGFFTTISTVFRSFFLHKRQIEYVVTTSLRQGILFAGLTIAALILLSLELFVWWVAILVILLISVLEFIFLSTGN